MVWFYWPPANLVLTRVIAAHDVHGRGADVLAVAFSPDGRLLASGGRDGKAKICDLVAKAEPVTVLTQNRPVPSLVFSPDGLALAVAGGGNGLITICDPVSGTQRLTWKADKEDDRPAAPTVPAGPGMRPPGATDEPAPYFPMVGRLSYSPDGRLLVSGGNALRIWDAETGRQKAHCVQPNAVDLRAAAFSPDGRQMASCYRNGLVALWDPDTGSERSLLKYQGDWIFRDAAFSPDGKTIVVSRSPGGWDMRESGRIVVLDNTSGKVISNTAVSHSMVADVIAYSPDGKLLACSGGSLFSFLNHPITYLFDATDWRCLAQADADAKDLSLPQAMAFSPDGNQLVIGDSDGSLRFWDVSPYRGR